MPQYNNRQSAGVNNNNNNGGTRNGVASDHVSIGVRGGGTRHHNRQSKHRRSGRKISIRLCIFTLSFILSVSAFLFYFLLFHTTTTTTTTNKGGKGGGEQVSRHQTLDDDDDVEETDTDFLTNVTRFHNHLKFGHGSNKDHPGNGLYNEAGRNELKMYQAEYEASLNNIGQHSNNANDLSGNADEYVDDIDLEDAQMEEYDDFADDDKNHSAATEDRTQSSRDEYKKQDIIEEADKASNDLSSDESSVSNSQPSKIHNDSKKKPKRRRHSGSCEMKVLNSSALIVEPIEGRKFARFSLQYTEEEEDEENPSQDGKWEPKFGGHQSLTEREDSFMARDQKINCGFVKGPKESQSTGFDLAEDDAKYMSSCHIAVMSCIFGNSDRLRSPGGKAVSRISKKNVCFVMFMDEVTLHTLSSEGQMPDTMGYIGLWRIVVVKNLPYTDMRRVGKIPKFLSHRLFPSARYSIWLDSKLRLQLDPLLVLEYFLWRKGYEYAISNHYDRHCLWEEVAQNKRLNKYNHSVIDEQFAFYRADGMRRFNASDANKLLPSNVPEGSLIVRAHTPMSNLFSCLWFNEVDRFTPRDQLSFAYTYHKLRRMNPEKPFYLHMFKDCERRKIAKLYRHRS